jgi:hypothetical protein
MFDLGVAFQGVQLVVNRCSSAAWVLIITIIFTSLCSHLAIRKQASHALWLLCLVLPPVQAG